MNYLDFFFTFLPNSFHLGKTGRLFSQWAGCGLFIFFAVYLSAQQIGSPKYEFRGVWVTTVNNIDYPKKPSAHRVALKEQWRVLLDQLEATGFNAVIFQVRPASDAFYPSEIVPWSRYMSGTPNQGPVPVEFDPLAFMIEETHRRGMEFHAWMNPYRVTTNLDTASLSERHVFRQHRDWVLRYGNRFYLDPGLPEVRQHLMEVVAEVVEKYDVDAIHFDDYFYPYKIKDQAFPDSVTYYIYGQQFNRIEDWRRANVDALIEQTSLAIKEIKPYVKFGVSPFGVWRNGEVDPFGSDTRAGATCFDDLYADVVKWLREGWIDYVIPQLYWNIGFPPADHGKLINWWALNSFDQELYVGHAAYKVGNNREPAWHDPNEIPRQIQLNRSNWIAQGSAFFSSQTVLQNSLGVRDSIAKLYEKPALVPPPLDPDVSIFQPPKLKRVGSAKGEVKLKWRPNKLDREKPPAYYVVYRFEGKDYKGLDDGGNILEVTPFFENKKRFRLIDKTARAERAYVYTVTAVNRQHVESDPSKRRKILKTSRGVKNLR